MPNDYELHEYYNKVFANEHYSEFKTYAPHLIIVFNERVFQEILYDQKLDLSRMLHGDIYLKFKRGKFDLSAVLDSDRQVVLNLNQGYPKIVVPVVSGHIVDHWQREFDHYTFKLRTVQRKKTNPESRLVQSLAHKYYSGKKFTKFNRVKLEVESREKAKIVITRNVKDYNISSFIDRVIDGPGNSSYQPVAKKDGYDFELNGGDDVLYQPDAETRHNLYLSSYHFLKSCQVVNSKYRPGEFSFKLFYRTNQKDSSFELRSKPGEILQNIPITIHLNRDEEKNRKFEKLRVVMLGKGPQKRFIVMNSEGDKLREAVGGVELDDLIDRVISNINVSTITFRNTMPVIHRKNDVGNVAYYTNKKSAYNHYIAQNGDLYLNGARLFKFREEKGRVARVFLTVGTKQNPLFASQFVDQFGKPATNDDVLEKNQDIFKADNIPGRVFSMPMRYTINDAGVEVEIPRVMYNLCYPKPFVDILKKKHTSKETSYNLTIYAKAEDEFGNFSDMTKIEHKLFFKMHK